MSGSHSEVLCCGRLPFGESEIVSHIMGICGTCAGCGRVSFIRFVQE